MKKILLITTTAATLIFSGCAGSEKKNTMRGAGIGAAAGGVIGAVAGKGKGAVIGAVIGGGLGALAGSRMDKQAKELEKVAETKRTEQGLVTKLKSDILFDTGKAELKPEAKSNLEQMAEIMKKYPENVLTVKGYTDSTGSEEINEILSEKRARAVKNTLVASGLPEPVIGTAGLGPTNPIADNSSAAGRRQNRRVEIEVTVDESKIPKTQKK
ncbi:MAG: OmpA family protein [Bacteriovorax sp.]|jgi:outer membrane protein OmpA-like peptidoglycan-associated protein